MAIIIRTVLISSCLLLFQILQVESLCKINANNGMHSTHPPFVLIEVKNKPGYYSTINHERAKIVFPSEGQFHVTCPYGTEKRDDVAFPGEIFVGKKSIGKSNALVKCLVNGKFEINEKMVKFNEISCKKNNYEIFLRPSNSTCLNSTSYEIGYHFDDKYGFLKLIDFCRDDNEIRTKWVHSTIQPHNKPTTRFDATGKRFLAYTGLYGGLGNKDPYKPENTYFQFQRLLRDNVERYVSSNASDGKFFVKGHLIAREDKLSKRDQDATNFNENFVPIWHSIYAEPGTWHFIGEKIRNLVNTKSRVMDVYAGGIGTLEIEGHDLYLFELNKIPVPKILFKCLVDHRRRIGLCFLVVNNPYVEEHQLMDSIICRKMIVCDTFFIGRKESLGYGYCCELKDFYEATVMELGDQFESMKNYQELWPLNQFNV